MIAGTRPAEVQQLLISRLKVRFLPRSPFFKRLGGSACCLRAVCECKARDLGECLTLLIRDHMRSSTAWRVILAGMGMPENLRIRRSRILRAPQLACSRFTFRM